MLHEFGVGLAFSGDCPNATQGVVVPENMTTNDKQIVVRFAVYGNTIESK